MLLRFRLSVSLATVLFVLAPLRAAAVADAPAEEVADAEAQRLYERANDFVTNILEGEYSYTYMQFYWKRAQSNIERVLRVYPETPIARSLRSGEVKVGPFEPLYFRERVLPRLEEKQEYAFDQVTCAIFLAGLDENRWDETRLAAIDGVVEVLSRQKRWTEAVVVPVLDEHKPRLIQNVFRVAARYDQTKTVQELLENTQPEHMLPLWAIYGEAQALLGKPREEIAKFLDEHPEDEVKLAVLRGMVMREIEIRRAATLRLPIKDTINATHYQVANLEVRDNVESVARTFFPRPHPGATTLLATYHAALGRRPELRAVPETHVAYLDHLALVEKFDELAAYPSTRGLSQASRTACELKLVELLAQAGRVAESDRARAKLAASSPALADAAVLAQFRGQLNSLDSPLIVRENSFSKLEIKDPCVLSQAVSEFSLAPRRNMRGANPWDSVVHKYLPGFVNLPLPKSKAVGEAASTSKQF